jgi:hypothetical protein
LDIADIGAGSEVTNQFAVCNGLICAFRRDWRKVIIKPSGFSKFSVGRGAKFGRIDSR